MGDKTEINHETSHHLQRLRKSFYFYCFQVRDTALVTMFHEEILSIALRTTLDAANLSDYGKLPKASC